MLLASDLDASGSAGALAALCRDYWYPLYAYIRRRGCSAEDAEDLTQEFFHRLLTRNLLEGITREGGKFRSFLLTAVKRFLSSEWQRGQAQKRGGGRTILSLNANPEDCYKLEPLDDMTPERLFEKRWAFATLDQTMRALELEYAAKGRKLVFQALHPILFGRDAGESYARIANVTGMTEQAIKTEVYRLRKRYGTIVREEIGRCVANPEEIDGELRHLFAVSVAFGYSYAATV